MRIVTRENMRTLSKHNQIAKANTYLIGQDVAFKILIIGKTMGRARPRLEFRIGKVKEVHNSLVVIEGSRGELYNRPIGKITLLEAGR